MADESTPKPPETLEDLAYTLLNLYAHASFTEMSEFTSDFNRGRKEHTKRIKKLRKRIKAAVEREKGGRTHG